MKPGLRFAAAVAAVLSLGTLGGCSTYSLSSGVTYSYEPRFAFAQAKTYRWVAAQPTYRQDPLVEANVRFAADRVLADKGLGPAADKADLAIWVGYDFAVNNYSYGNELRMLTLNIAAADGKTVVWRGMATGSIMTDAGSGDLARAVETMLAKFPPK